MRLPLLVIVFVAALAATRPHAQAPAATPPAAEPAPVATPPAPALTAAEQANYAAAQGLLSLAYQTGAQSKAWTALQRAEAQVAKARAAYQATLQRQPAWQAYAERRRTLEAAVAARGLRLQWSTGALTPAPAKGGAR